MKVRLSTLAEHLGAKLIGNPEFEVHAVAPIQRAQAHELTYLVGGQYAKFLKTTQAGAVILNDKCAENYSGNALIVENPEFSFARALKDFFEPKKTRSPGIHPSVVVGEHSSVDPSATLGPYVVIGENTRIGPHVHIHAGAVLGDRVSIAQGVTIHSRVTIEDGTEIGEGSIIFSGAVLGSDGFGYVNHRKTWEKIPQVGRVIIGKQVEIGANTAIDRGAIDDTVIGDGVKIDNLVQVAHNVKIGEHTIIAGCTVIAGSVRLGRHCMIGGAVVINNHVEICDGAIITGTAVVLASVETPGVYSSGIPAQPHRQWFKILARLLKLDDMEKRLAKLEKMSD